MAGLALGWAALSLRRSGKPSQAVELYIKEIVLSAASEEAPITSLENLAIALRDLGQWARAERARSLAFRLAELHEDEDDVLWLSTNQVENNICRGNLPEAEAALAPLRAKAADGSLLGTREAHILKTDLQLRFRCGIMDDALAASTTAI